MTKFVRSKKNKLVDLVIQKKSTIVEGVNEVLREASQGSMKGIIL